MIKYILIALVFIGCGTKVYEEHKAPPEEIILPEVPIDPERPRWNICVDVEVIKDGVKDCVLMPEKGKKFSLVDVSFVNCPACRQDFPIFDKLAKDVEATTTATVLLFKDSRQDTLDYIADEKLWFTHRTAYDAGAKQVQKLGIMYTPTTFLFDEKGNVMAKYVGVLTSKQITAIKTAVK